MRRLLEPVPSSTESARELRIVGNAVVATVVHMSVHQETGGTSWVPSGTPDFRLSIERTSDGWIVEDAETGVFGFGETFLDSAKDFRSAVRDHIDVLQRQDRLSPALAAQLDYLRARFRS